MTLKEAIAAGYKPMRYIRDNLRVGTTIEMRWNNGLFLDFRERIAYVTLTTPEEIEEYKSCVRELLGEVAKVSS